MANAMATAAVASNVARTHKRKNAFSKTLQSTSKQLIWLFSINGILWIWCSYALAFMDKMQIAESLSSNVCTVVLGQMGMYLITKTLENCFKYNEGGIFGTSNQKQLDREVYVDTDGDGIPDSPISEVVSTPDTTEATASDATGTVTVPNTSEEYTEETAESSDTEYDDNGGVDPTKL